MRNLIKAVEAEQKNRLNEFVFSINQVTDLKGLNAWQYTDLLPKGKDVSMLSVDALRAYLITRKEKAIYKGIEREVSKIKTVFEAGTLIDCRIQMEWKRSRMWGNNPTAEAWYSYKDKEGNTRSNYVKSGSIGGCGYDKGSTAVAEVLNQINEVLKPLWIEKDRTPGKANHDLLGYGSGYGILPSIEGGVGASCYPTIFSKVGYEFKTVASGKSFDAYSITKKA